jgi:hypothetical protein
MAAAGVEVPLVHASAERVPLPDASFDVVFCDHGAMSFADPYAGPCRGGAPAPLGGLFAFNHGSPILSIAWAADDERAGDRYLRLLQDASSTTATRSIQPAVREWIRLFRVNGFAIEDLIEPRRRPTRRAAIATTWSGNGPDAGLPSPSGDCRRT